MCFSFYNTITKCAWLLMTLSDRTNGMTPKQLNIVYLFLQKFPVSWQGLRRKANLAFKAPIVHILFSRRLEVKTVFWSVDYDNNFSGCENDCFKGYIFHFSVVSKSQICTNVSIFSTDFPQFVLITLIRAWSVSVRNLNFMYIFAKKC